MSDAASFGFLDGIMLLGLAGIVVLALGLARGLSSLGRILVGVQSRTWPTVEGVVVASRVRSTSRWGGRTSRRVYLPEVVYEYSLDERRYVSERVAIGSLETAFAIGSERVVDEFPAGAKVEVHHHPARPELTTLLTGPRSGDVVAFGASLVASVIGVAIVRWSWSMGARPEGLRVLVDRFFG